MTLGEGAEMKFSFIKPNKLIFEPENGVEIYELGTVMGQAKLPHTIRVSGELGKETVKDVAISTKDLWFWLQKPKEQNNARQDS